MGPAVPSGTALPAQASPPALCPAGRTRDLDALLAVMGGAREFIYASVMEYFPTSRFRHPPRWVGREPDGPGGWRPLLLRAAPGPSPLPPGPLSTPSPPLPRYWPALDTALRVAAVGRGVRVRLLVSCWLNTDPSMFPYLRSLQALSNPAANVSVDVVRPRSLLGGEAASPAPTHPLCPQKVFIVPVGNHSNIPFSRVNHSKFMVTEKAAYIGEQGQGPRALRGTQGVTAHAGHTSLRKGRRRRAVAGVLEGALLFCPAWSPRDHAEGDCSRVRVSPAGSSPAVTGPTGESPDPRSRAPSSQGDVGVVSVERAGCPPPRRGATWPGLDDGRVAHGPTCPPSCVWGHRTGPGHPASPSAHLPAGTSNWSEDYFTSTSGVGLVVSQRAPRTQPGVATMQEQLRQLFERDWSSRYAVGLDGQAQGQDCVWQG